jgi:hypothetical protein
VEEAEGGPDGMRREGLEASSSERWRGPRLSGASGRDVTCATENIGGCRWAELGRPSNFFIYLNFQTHSNLQWFKIPLPEL